jgi:hypothetical protein
VRATGTLLLSVTDVIGRSIIEDRRQEVSENTVFETALSVEGMPPGTYILHLRIQDTSGTTTALSRRFSVVR